jgi:DNA uptake protein ComE-like DNA-binding protein
MKTTTLLRTTFTALALTFTLTFSSHAQLGRQQGLLDPNTAAEADLAKLPHFNESLAKDLVAQRPFLSMTQLNQHLSAKLSKEQLTEVYGKLFLHLNLNTASEAEILLIPGLGRRMAHEFEEYRPYKSYAQFRKEIGKYVDEKEVARLEQFTFIPIDLNSASDEDILTIPGLGRRMLHEFKEYRPYKNIEQFRKEIGKYVNEKEVARLERYVTINP